MIKLLLLHLLTILPQQPVTFTGVEHIPATDSLKITIRMSYELFLKDYQQSVLDDLDMEVLRKMNPFPSDMANNYINTKINIQSGRKPVIGKLIRMTRDDQDVIFLTLFRVDRRLRTVTLKNTLLTGLFSDVENLTIVRSGKNESVFKFTPEFTEKQLVFK